ncbi:hypothetical protein ISR92_01365 [Patescibacteria group bacterium]|nr:hypothetical protein [Patescibacteria group bacterium]
MSKKLIFLLVLVSLLALPMIQTVHASPSSGDVRALTGIDEDVTNPGLGEEDLDVVVQEIIKVILGFLGLIAVVIILVGGFFWMTAGGNEDNVKKGRKWIINGVIGLLIVLSAYAIAEFAISNAADVTTQ